MTDYGTVNAGALWLGAALSIMKDVAQGEPNPAEAQLWLNRVPNEVKRVWPGIFPEFPYEGEPEEERIQRERADGR